MKTLLLSLGSFCFLPVRVLRISCFYRITGTYLGDESRVWVEFIEPGGSLDFEAKLADYDAAREVRIDLTGAKEVD